MSRKIVIDYPTEDETLPSGSVIHWEKISRRNGYRRVLVTCGICHKTRTIEPIKAKGKHSEKFTGCCNLCRIRQLNNFMGKHVDHPAWKGGRFVTNGYWNIQVITLTGRAREIAEQMSRSFPGQSRVVAEHRLTVALSLDRPLARHEVVHHRNGNKLDNRLENLEITTPANHRKLDVKYYDLWQEALKEIERLEALLEIEKSKSAST